MDSIFYLFIWNNNDDEDVDGMALLSSGDDVKLKNVRGVMNGWNACCSKE